MTNQSNTENLNPTDTQLTKSGVLIRRLAKHQWSMEIVIALIVSFVIGVAFFLYGRGGPNSSDITLYMNVGMNGIKMPFILNRYFHVFLQAIFLKLAPHPLEGYHAFWGFIMGFNTFLVYITARKVLKRSNLFHGILAVLFLFSMSPIAETSGVIVVDFTAMTMLMAFFAVYVWSMNKDHTNPWIIGLLGCLIYLAFKTKETTLPVAVLMIGLGWVNGEGFNLKEWLRNLFWVACGGVVGIILFGILSWVFVGDPFFGLRISEWQEFLGTYAVYSSRVLETLNSLGDGNLDNWYEGYWFEITLLPFLYYLISGIKLRQKTSVKRKLLWLVPLAYTVLMIISINNRLGYELRFGLPILPVLSVLAPQFLKLTWPNSRLERRKFLVSLITGLFISIGIRFLFRAIISSPSIDLGSVILLVYYPLLLTTLLASLFLFKDWWLWHLINFLIVFSLVVSPVTSNFRSMFVIRDNQESFSQVVKPFSKFKERIVYSPDMRFYAVDDVFTKSELRINKNLDELVALFNIYFDASATRENFTYAEAPLNIAEDILDEYYDYVLMTVSDWRALQSNLDILSQVLMKYEIFLGSDEMFVLLDLRE